MKALILDHYRRWGWALALGGVLELLLGWFGGPVAGKAHELWAWQFQIGLFTGAFLLSFDLQRGSARSALALPLTARQIGRAWWLATVAIPAAGYSALQFLGAGAHWRFAPESGFNPAAPMMASLYLTAILGCTFPLALLNGQVAGASGWRRLGQRVAGASWGLIVGGGFFVVQRVSGDPVKLACFLAVASAATVAGWFLAERLVVGRASSRAAAQPAGKRGGPVPVPAGCGGIPRLIGTTFLRAFLMGGAMIVLMPVFFILMGGGKGSWWEALRFFPGMGTFALMFVMFLSVMPVMAHMRMLRSLPASPAVLAVALLASAVLPLTALQMVMMGLGWLASGTAGLTAALNAFLITLPAVALVLILVARLGIGIGAYLALIVTLPLMQLVPVFWARSPEFGGSLSMLALVATLAGVVLLFISFWVVRWSLMTNSRLYRAPAGVFGKMGWGGGQ